jgi:rubredoxin
MGGRKGEAIGREELTAAGGRLAGRLAGRGKMQRPIVTYAKLMTEKQESRTWMCLICGFIYDEAAGLPEEGIAPGTRWEDIPMNWNCPECGARKEDFEMVEL